MRRLTSFGGPLLGAPAFSPDGEQIVFSAWIGTTASLFVVPSKGGEVRRLTHETDAHDLVPAFSPDGTSVTFGSNRADGWNVWRKSLDGGAPTRVTTEGGFACRTAADGRLYYTRLDRPGIFSVPSGGGAETRVVEEHGRKHWANWDVRGDALVHLSRSGWSEARVRRVDLATGESVELGVLSAGDHPDAHLGVEGVALSPDGHWLYFAREDESSIDIRLLEPPGSM